jgi:hypothetical protein
MLLSHKEPNIHNLYVLYVSLLGGSIHDVVSCYNIIGSNDMTIVGFEVLTAVVMNTSIFCDIMQLIPLKVNRRFGRTCGLLL